MLSNICRDDAEAQAALDEVAKVQRRATRYVTGQEPRGGPSRLPHQTSELSTPDRSLFRRPSSYARVGVSRVADTILLPP